MRSNLAVPPVAGLGGAVEAVLALQNGCSGSAMAARRK
jgi:hypothetical protein